MQVRLEHVPNALGPGPLSAWAKSSRTSILETRELDERPKSRDGEHNFVFVSALCARAPRRKFSAGDVYWCPAAYASAHTDAAAHLLRVAVNSLTSAAPGDFHLSAER